MYLTDITTAEFHIYCIWHIIKEWKFFVPDAGKHIHVRGYALSVRFPRLRNKPRAESAVLQLITFRYFLRNRQYSN